MNLYQCQKKAMDIGFNCAAFEAEFPVGTLICKWVDAHLGFFKIGSPGLKGAVAVAQIDQMFPGLECEDLHVPRIGDEK